MAPLRSVASVACLAWAAASPQPPSLIEGVAKAAAVHVSSEGAAFPIITGCLDQCGEEDPACVSQCQVCVEANGCKTIDRRCNPCLEEVKEMRHTTRRTADVIKDSGGTSLVHDGLSSELDAARRMQLQKERKLIAARDDVLQAQRQAEWAVGEREEAARKVDEAHGAHNKDGEKRERWKRHHDKKVDKLEEDQDDRKEEHSDAKQRLEQSRKELKAAEERLEKQHSVVEDREKAHEDVKNAKKKEQKLEVEVHEKEQAVKDAEDAEGHKREDAAWVDGELGKEEDVGETGVLEAKGELRKARTLERAARDQLESSKNRYRKVTAERQRTDRTVAKLEGKLEDHPLPTFVPQDRRRLLQRRAERSAAALRSSRFVPVAVAIAAASLGLML